MNALDKSINRRAHERFTVPPMYSHVKASLAGAQGPAMHGHAYDISECGVRIELDEPVHVGERLSVSIGLPGTGDIACIGAVVWINDELDDPGPRRLALRITEFAGDRDRHRLMQYIGSGRLARAA